MKVEIVRLHGTSIRLRPEPLDISGGIVKPIDITVDGEIIDGMRRVEAARKAGESQINARIWESGQQYHEFQAMEFAALTRNMVRKANFGEA